MSNAVFVMMFFMAEVQALNTQGQTARHINDTKKFTFLMNPGNIVHKSSAHVGQWHQYQDRPAHELELHGKQEGNILTELAVLGVLWSIVAVASVFGPIGVIVCCGLCCYACCCPSSSSSSRQSSSKRIQAKTAEIVFQGMEKMKGKLSSEERAYYYGTEFDNKCDELFDASLKTNSRTNMLTLAEIEEVVRREFPKAMSNIETGDQTTRFLRVFNSERDVFTKADFRTLCLWCELVEKKGLDSGYEGDTALAGIGLGIGATIAAASILAGADGDFSNAADVGGGGDFDF